MIIRTEELRIRLEAKDEQSREMKTHLVHVENEVQLAHVFKSLVQSLHKHLEIGRGGSRLEW